MSLMGNFLVLGAAKSGIAAALLLKKQGAWVCVIDQHTISDDVKYVLTKQDIFFEIAEHVENSRIFTGNFAADWALVVSPGISLENEFVRFAKANQRPVVSEIEVASWFLNDKTVCVGITGTNGKSTTASYTAQLLARAGKNAYACGNIGTPFSQIVMNISKNEKAVCVLELSSYQLETTQSLQCVCTAILNLQNDHLERHKTFEEYLRVKWKLALMTRADGLFIVDAQVLQKARALGLAQPQCKVEILNFKNNLWNVQNPCLLGDHNFANVMCASLIARHLGVSDEIIKLQWEKQTSQYVPLPHRLERVGSFCQEFVDIQGRKKRVVIMNDSKATNVESTLVALKSFDAPVRLLLGGKPKGDSYIPIANFTQKNIVKIYPFGAARNVILEELNPVHEFLSKAQTCLLDAAQQALLESCDGDVILLSPACSSFDEFQNFEHRGDVFRNWALSCCEGSSH